jgi:hypothetical protein
MRHASIALVALMPLACHSADPLPGPEPTELYSDYEAHASHKKQRREWIERMHRAGPGVDWRAIERANGLAEQERRNLLANAPAMAQQWTEIGSDNQAGRMHCTAIGPDGTTLYAGSALAGVWRGNLDGTGWSPIGDNLFGGAHEIVVLPGESVGAPDVVIASTELGELRTSRDLGATWETPTGLDPLLEIRGLAQLQDGVPTLLVLGQVDPADTPALYSSSDYGRTYTKIWSPAVAGQASMWVPRTGPQAATHVYLAYNGQILTSSTGGTNPALTSTVNPNSDAAVLTGSEAGAPTLYVAFRDTGTWGLHHSADAGATVTPKHLIADPLFGFFQSLSGSILQPDTVMYGGFEVFRSTTAGTGFAEVNNWTAYYTSPADNLHADIPGLHVALDPQDPQKEIWHVSTDGGLFESRDFGATVSNLSLDGLGVSQYYTTHTAVDDLDLITAGSQDQGFQRGFRQPSTGPGPSSSFEQLISGDVGHLTSGDGKHDWLFGSFPGFFLIQMGQYTPTVTALPIPGGANSLWLPPVVGDPLANSSFFFCAERLFRFDHSGGLSFTPALHSTQVFNAGEGGVISALAFAPSDPQRAYVVTDTGQFYVSDDHGVTWTNTTGGGPAGVIFYGNALAVHPADKDEVAVGGSGYSSPGVLRSTDGGQTWLPEATGLPQTFVYDLAYAVDGSGDLFAGAHNAPYHWDRDAATWANIAANQAPIMVYWSVESVGTDVMRFGTYGRGIWDYSLQDRATGVTYCVAKTNSQGCVPTMTFAGTPSVTSPAAYDVGASMVLNQKVGLLFYGYAASSSPFQGGTKCVANPVKRTPTQNSGGNPPPNDCSGVYSFDFNARIQSGIDPGLVAGADVYSQYWSRDPTAPFTTGLTNGLTFTIQP